MSLALSLSRKIDPDSAKSPYGDGGSGVTEEMIELMHRFDKLSVMPKTEHLGAAVFLHKNFDGNQNLATWDG